MKLSRNWLNDFLDLGGFSNEELSEIVTTRIAEVDQILSVGVPLEKAVIAEVVSVSAHPKKDSLSLVEISLGAHGKKSVVCGASNVRPGLKTIYVPVGGVFLKEGELLEVSLREVAGVVSDGMLVSLRELDAGTDHESGIVELQEGEAGASATTVLGGTDLVIEIDNKSLTHRPDLWSHFGFARELSAVLNRPLKVDLDSLSDDNESGAAAYAPLLQGAEAVRVVIEQGTKLRRMVACIFENVTVTPSPLWMKRRLYTIGAGVRNFLVDLSNYVMHDCGQPNHFFDADRIESSEIRIRFAKAGEKLTALDQIERHLTTEDLVIADSRRALDIGGIVGGHDTSVHEDTKRILFTAGSWDPVLVRKSAQRHQARTDAAQRFEKNLSPYYPVLALQRVRELLGAGTPSAKIVGRVADVFPERPAPVKIRLTAKLVKERLGNGAPSFEESCELLRRLRLTFLEKSADHCVVEVPHYRAMRDLLQPEDLIEEIGRCHGYENIHETPPLLASTPCPLPPVRELEHEVRDLLRGAGFSEVSNYSFTISKYSSELGYDMSKAVEIANPLDADQGALRVSLVPGMIDVLGRNGRYFEGTQFFELGRSYHLESDPRFATYTRREKLENLAAHEKYLLCVATMTEEAAFSPLGKIDGSEFYALLGIVKKVLSLRTAEPIRAEPLATPLRWMHPYRAAEIFLGSYRIGTIAEARPDLGLQKRAVIAEIELESLLEVAARRQFVPVSKFPSSLFEMSIVCPKRTEFRTLEKMLRQNVPGELLRNLEVLSVYEGKPLAEGEKSVSVRLTFGAAERTLPSEELTALQDTLMASVERAGYALRR